MRQGNDIGTQYRSVCYCSNEDAMKIANASMQQYQNALQEIGMGIITTEIKNKQPYFFAEEYHQQYLDKNPNGYCGIGGTGCEFER
jgi:peptide-methionine (S)-S-oxide reductase